MRSRFTSVSSFPTWWWIWVILGFNYTFKFSWRIWKIFRELSNVTGLSFFIWIWRLEWFIMKGLWSFSISIYNLFWNLSCWNHWILFIDLSTIVEMWLLFCFLREWFFLNLCSVILQFFSCQFFLNVIIVLNVRNYTTKRHIPSNFTNLNLLAFHIWCGSNDITLLIFIVFHLSIFLERNIFIWWFNIGHIAFISSQTKWNFSRNECFIMTSIYMTVFLSSSHHT